MLGINNIKNKKKTKKEIDKDIKVTIEFEKFYIIF